MKLTFFRPFPFEMCQDTPFSTPLTPHPPDDEDGTAHCLNTPPWSRDDTLAACSRASTPATCGAAKLVPTAVAGTNWDPSSTLSTRMGSPPSPPGALRARVSPQLLYAASLPSLVDAPMESTPLQLPGK
jgi:hypothetical protein